MSDQLPQHSTESIPVADLDTLFTHISTKMNIRRMEPFLAKLLIDRWDTLTKEQRMTRTLKIPPQCYICGVDRDSFDGDGFVHFSPDPRVGYTKLYCSQCCLHSLEASHDDDDDDEGWNADEFSVGGASQPAPSSSAPPTVPPPLASAWVLIDSPSSPLMIQSIRRLFLRLRIPPPVCA